LGGSEDNKPTTVLQSNPVMKAAEYFVTL